MVCVDREELIINNGIQVQDMIYLLHLYVALMNLCVLDDDTFIGCAI